MIEEGSQITNGEFDNNRMDAELISGTKRVEQAKIAAYDTACTFAELLGEGKHISLLHQTLDEEKQADAELAKLSKEINTAA